MLFPALQVQNRVNVLSRPPLQTLDNQTAYINVGQNVPYVNGFTANGTTGVNTPVVAYKDTGVTMQVTPRITPDGRVLMRVIPDVSSISPSTVNLGNGVTGTIFNTQHVETTVLANDGETVMLGGLITKRDEKTENKIPWVGDLPVIGAAFRYRTYVANKTELIIIMTPHIVRNRLEGERIVAEEVRRINWNLKDVMRVHGSENCSTFLPEALPEPQSRVRPFRIYPGVPAGAEAAPRTQTPVNYTAPEPAPEPAAQPRKLGQGAILKSLFVKSAPTQSSPVDGAAHTGVLKSLFVKSAPPPVYVVVEEQLPAPTMQTTVEYAPAPVLPTIPPLPTLLPDAAPAPRPVMLPPARPAATLPVSLPSSPGMTIPPIITIE